MTDQAAKTTQTIGVKVYAMVSTNYTCTDPDTLKDQECDIFFSTTQGCEDREDLGADQYHYSVDGKDEMVMVNKELLEALVAHCQKVSETDAVYNDARGTSFKYSDLNDLVLGMQFPESVTHS